MSKARSARPPIMPPTIAPMGGLDDGHWSVELALEAQPVIEVDVLSVDEVNEGRVAEVAKLGYGGEELWVKISVTISIDVDGAALLA
jgi:hypothetical protein